MRTRPTEAVDAHLEPVTTHIEYRCANLRIVVVQIGLLTQEVVEIILPAPRLPLPGRSPENRYPVIGRRTVLLCVRPNVPVGLRVIFSHPAFEKPHVLIGRVAQNLVHENFEPALVSCIEQSAEVLHRSKKWIDLKIVGDVVAEIQHRRLDERRDP